MGKQKKPQWIGLALLLVPVLLYLPGIFGGVPFPSEQAPYTDLLITHLPYALYIKNSLMRLGVVPLWYGTIFSGTPLASNPLSGLFYLPGWLAFLLPLPAGFSFCLALHAVFGSWGMYRFLKQQGRGDMGALAGGLALGLMPKLAAHYGAGHISLIYAICWTPWLLKVSGDRNGIWKTGAVAAAIFTADPRWCLYACVLWLGYKIAHRHFKSMIEAARFLLLAGLQALLLSAPLLLPLLEFIRLSSRSGMTPDDMVAYSLPLDRITGLLIPASGANTEWYIYAGGILLILYLVQLSEKQLWKKNLCWSIWPAVGLVVAIGAGYLNGSWLNDIPLLSLMRVPTRIMFASGFALAVIAGNTIDRLDKKTWEGGRTKYVAVGAAFFAVLMMAGIALTTQGMALPAYWGLAFLAAGSIIIILAVAPDKQQQRLNIWVPMLVLLVAFDLAGAGWMSISIRPYSETTFHDHEILDILQQEKDYFRIYSPSYSLPQQTASVLGLELADGVDPLQIALYVNFMEQATGVPSDGYAVSIPPFRTGNPAIDNIDFIPDASLLGLLNVKYLLAQYPIAAEGFYLVERSENHYLYRNQQFRPRIWVEGDLQPGGAEPEIVSWSPNRVEISAEGPGNLVASEIYYPGWKAYIDGKLVKINQAYTLLRSIDLEAGKHFVVMKFFPVSLIAGLVLAGCGWILLLWQIRRK
jgi:hypothetical protein